MKFLEQYGKYIAYGLLALGILVLKVQLQGARAAEREFALRADSLEAANDTTRFVTQIETAEGTANVWQRRAIQAELERDDLDKELGQETRARADLEVRIAALTGTATDVPVVETPEGVRTAEFHVAEEWGELDANVALPPPPQTATGSFDVRLHPFTLGMRVACLTEDDSGLIQPAVVDVTSPEWAAIDISAAMFDPEVCNPPESHGWSLFNLNLPAGPIAGGIGGAAAGALIDTDDRLQGALTGALVGILSGLVMEFVF